MRRAEVVDSQAVRNPTFFQVLMLRKNGAKIAHMFFPPQKDILKHQPNTFLGNSLRLDKACSHEYHSSSSPYNASLLLIGE
jgi:hypothetical protein